MNSEPHGGLATERNVIGLVLWIALCLGGGIALGVVFRPDAWFYGLHHPSFAPPNWLFAPVWSTLYVLMGIAMWRVDGIGAASPAQDARRAFLIQLALNFSWAPVFFGAHAIVGAMVVISALWLAIGAAFILFHRVDRPAAWLLLPYWAWVSFATALNGAYLVMN